MAGSQTHDGGPLLDVRDLSVRYGAGVAAIRGVALSVRRAGITALLGPNGAGKTTIARAITGMLGLHGGAISGGTITFEGRSLVGQGPRRVVRAGVSQVLEGRQTVAELSVADNLRIGGYTRRGRSGELGHDLDHVLDLFPVLRQRYHDRAGFLSGGEQQMLVIARALMQRPHLLVLDEPSLGLSPKMAGEITALIRRINADGVGILLIEQNAAAALDVSSYAYLLESGEIAMEGPSAEIATDDHVRRAYLGTGDAERSYRGAVEVAEPALDADGTGAPELLVEDLSLRIGGVKALDGVSFQVEKGEFFAVIGPNGAGKTSLLNSLSGFYRPQQGRLAFAGESLLGRSPAQIARLGAARTFQNLALFDHLPVIDNVMVGRERFRRRGALAGALWKGPARAEEKRAREVCSEVIDMVGLSPYRDRPAGTLPYGLRKRVELARALALEPRLLLLDEPVAGMGFDETAELASYVTRARAALGLTVVMVEHDLHLVMDVADRILVLDFGHPLALDVPAVVRADPAVVAAYIGSVEGEAAAAVERRVRGEDTAPPPMSGVAAPAREVR